MITLCLQKTGVGNIYLHGQNDSNYYMNKNCLIKTGKPVSHKIIHIKRTFKVIFLEEYNVRNSFIHCYSIIVILFNNHLTFYSDINPEHKRDILNGTYKGTEADYKVRFNITELSPKIPMKSTSF